MKWPPLAIYLKLKGVKHGFRLWIPLFIIGPLFLLFLLAVFLVILPFFLVALVVAALAVVLEWQTEWLKETMKYLRWLVYGAKSVPAVIALLGSLTGTRINVENGNQKVFIAIY